MYHWFVKVIWEATRELVASGNPSVEAIMVEASRMIVVCFIMNWIDGGVLGLKLH